MSQTIQCQRCNNQFIADPSLAAILACPHCGLTYQFSAPASPPPPNTFQGVAPPVAPPPAPTNVSQIPTQPVPPHPGYVQPPVPPPTVQQVQRQSYSAPPPKPKPPVDSRSNRGLVIAGICGGAVLLTAIAIVAIFVFRKGNTGFSVARNDKPASVGENEFAKTMDFVQLPALTDGMNDETSVLNYRWKNNSSVNYAFEFSMSQDGDKLACSGLNSLTPVSTPPLQVFDAESVGGGEGYGTCFFIHPDGLAVTCEHVVRDATSVRISYKDQWHSARVVSIDEVRDIALLKVNLKNLPVLPVNPTKKLAIGQNLHVIGYPLNDVLGNSVKFNSGTLAGINDRQQATELQLNATVNPGNSGGPIVNQSGQVIGIATALLDGEGIASVAIGIHSLHLEEICKRNLVKIPFQTKENELKTVTLAGHATPAVCLVHVKQKSNKRIVKYESSFSVRSPASVRETPGSSQGQLLTDRRGEMIDVDTEQDRPIIFFSPGQIGIEKLGSTIRKSWQTRSLVLLSVPDSGAKNPLAISSEIYRRRLNQDFGRTRTPMREDPKIVPALESKIYRIDSENDSQIVIKVDYEIQTLIPDSEHGSMSVEMSGTVEFDKSKSLISKSSLRGHVIIESARGRKRMPVSLSYELSNKTSRISQ